MKISSPRFHNGAMFACLLICGILLTCFSERITRNHGMGWDGANYGDIILHYNSVVSGERSVTDAIYLRFLPALAARAVMLAFNIPLDAPHTVTMFQAWNIIMLCLAVFAWGRACDSVGMGAQGKWLGFCGLFLNFAVLKYSFYYPVLLDSSGLALGVVLIWLYLARRPWWTLFISLLSIIYAPPVGLQGFLLLTFPRPPASFTSEKPSRAYPTALALAVSGMAAYRYISIGPLNIRLGLDELHPFSVILATGFIFASVYYLSFDARFFRVKNYLHSNKSIKKFILILFACFLLAVSSRLHPKIPPLGGLYLFMDYVTGVLNYSVSRPGEFLVAHTLYFGPVMLLAICYFPALCAAVRSIGGGMILVVAFALLQFLCPLSRQMIGAIPFLILPLCLAIDNMPFPRPFLWIFALFSVTTSKVWMSINLGVDPGVPMEVIPEVWRRYTSSLGNYMLTEDYYQQGVLVIIALLILTVFRCWMEKFSKHTSCQGSRPLTDRDAE